MTDEDLARLFGVSVQTIRLDRLELSIPELRERLKAAAAKALPKVRSLTRREIVGELVDLELGKGGISIMEVTPEMVFSRGNIAYAHSIFSQANSLAAATVEADVVLTGVANIKYKQPAYLGEKLVAKAEVMRIRGNKHFVWVKTRVGEREVFRAKFILVAVDVKGGDTHEDSC